MVHGKLKRPTVQNGKPPHQQTTPPPNTPKTSRVKQIFWADDNDVDFEDITFVVPIVISAVILVVFFLRKYIRWTVQCTSNNRLDGKTVVITGANTGIGKATATELAKRGAKVIMGCRDKAKGEAVALMIRGKAKNSDVYSYQLDLASLSSIKDFAEHFANREPTLHVLINNAAYMGPRATTVDGYERCFGTNFLGHFYLTHLLSPKLRRGAPSRIINVISDSYSLVKINFEDIALAKYDIYKAYARSKLAMVVLNYELHRRMSSDAVSSFGVHPGCVSTELMRNWPGLTGNMLRAMARILFKSPEDGCQTIVFCAVADKLREQSGRVFENCGIYKIKSFAKDRELGERLWETARHLTGLDEKTSVSGTKKTSTDESVKVEEKSSKNEVENIGPVETKKDN